MIRELFVVAAGGALGSAARYLLSGVLLAGHTWCGFPVGTLAVNAGGSLLIGLLLGGTSSQAVAWFAIAGLCGGFTTFSTFSADAVRLLREGSYGSALGYIGLSIGACLLCTAAGMWLGGQMRHGN